MEAHKIGLVPTPSYRMFDSFPWGAGVDLFFIISGFIIAHIAFGVEPGLRSVTDFLVRRLIRIAPIYWFYTSLMVVAIILFPGNVKNFSLSFGHYLASVAFLPYPRPVDGMLRPVLGQGWTLNYEMFFYLVAAVALLASRNRRALLVCGLVGLSFLVGTLSANDTINTFFGFSIILEFILGIVIHHLFANGLRFGAAIVGGLLIAGLAGLTVAQLFVDETQWRFVGRGLPSALIAAAFILAKWPPLNDRPLLKGAALLGDASYSLYLSHPFVIIPLGILARKSGFIDLTLYALLAIASALIVSILSYRLIEMPMIQRFQARLPARRFEAVRT
jgi:peptidoglycan/LPS O-acetylase OafA/YrhL